MPRTGSRARRARPQSRDGSILGRPYRVDSRPERTRVDGCHADRTDDRSRAARTTGRSPGQIGEVAMKTKSSPCPQGVSRPAQRALASVGITEVDQATRITESELKKLHGMGPKAIDAMKAELKRRGKTFKKE